MKTFIIIALFVSLSGVVSAQVDGNRVPPHKGTSYIDTARHEVEIPFSKVLIDFRVKTGLSYITLAAVYGNVANNSVYFDVSYTAENVKEMERGELVLIPLIEREIRRFIKITLKK
jgi:hypothetical protein